MSGQLLDDATVFATQQEVPLLDDGAVFAGTALPEGAQPGASTWFATPDGEYLAGQFALVDTSDLRASHDENLRADDDHLAEIGRPDRGRAEHESAVQAIVREFDPTRLGDSEGVDTGAPVVGDDGLVEAGNTRTIALKRVYQANGAKAEAYRQYLRDHADELGITPESVDSMSKPVLVRVRQSHADRSAVGRPAADSDPLPLLESAATEIHQAVTSDGGVEVDGAEQLSDETRTILGFLASRADAPSLLRAAIKGEEHGPSEDPIRADTAEDEQADPPAGGEPEAAPHDHGADQVDGTARSGAAAQVEDGDWTAFRQDTTLGIPRAEMPQIRAEHHGPLVNFINARGIEHTQDEVPASSLKPTQAEFSPGKVQALADGARPGASILVSDDGRVIDGHHRWLAAMEKDQPVKIIRFSAPVDTLLSLAREFPSSQVDTATA